MFWNDIELVTEQVSKYGLRKPLADLGGMEKPCIADYDLTIRTGDQNARYVYLNQRPFDHIDKEYFVINPDKGDPLIEDLPYTHSNYFGTALCLNVIEHIENPFRVFAALFQIMKPNSLLIVETVFSFPYHPSPRDFWRYSPECLRFLSKKAGFTILECDWRLRIPADKGIQNITNGEPAEIHSVYVTLTKGTFIPLKGVTFQVPERFSDNGSAKEILQEIKHGQKKISCEKFKV